MLVGSLLDSPVVKRSVGHNHGPLNGLLDRLMDELTDSNLVGPGDPIRVYRDLSDRLPSCILSRLLQNIFYRLLRSSTDGVLANPVGRIPGSHSLLGCLLSRLIHVQLHSPLDSLPVHLVHLETVRAETTKGWRYIRSENCIVGLEVTRRGGTMV